MSSGSRVEVSVGTRSYGTLGDLDWTHSGRPRGRILYGPEVVGSSRKSRVWVGVAGAGGDRAGVRGRSTGGTPTPTRAPTTHMRSTRSSSWRGTPGGGRRTCPDPSGPPSPLQCPSMCVRVTGGRGTDESGGVEVGLLTLDLGLSQGVPIIHRGTWGVPSRHRGVWGGPVPETGVSGVPSR